MVHLSVAIAKFAETLFWGIAQAAGLAISCKRSFMALM